MHHCLPSSNCALGYNMLLLERCKRICWGHYFLDSPPVALVDSGTFHLKGLTSAYLSPAAMVSVFPPVTQCIAWRTRMNRQPSGPLSHQFNFESNNQKTDNVYLLKIGVTQKLFGKENTANVRILFWFLKLFW